METIEIVIYLFVAVITGILIISLIKGWDVRETYEGVKSVVSPDHEAGYKKLREENLVPEIYQFWEDCGLGTINLSETIYVESNQKSNISLKKIISQIKKLNLCDSLSSENQTCGRGEDINISSPIDLPAVIKLRCDTSRSQIFIT